MGGSFLSTDCMDFISHGVIIRTQIYTDLHRYTHHYVRVVGDAEPLGHWPRAVAISREKQCIHPGRQH